MRTTSRLMVTVALVIAPMVVWPSDGTPLAQDAVAPNSEFAKQWREVRAKYPLVALAYLQSVEALAEEAQAAPAHRVAVETAVRLGVATATRVPAPAVCAPCRLAINSGDVERYLGCLEKRIGCLKP